MTCQIILANLRGVVLATDTAVTRGDQVRNGMEKIFPLADPHRAGVLVAGSLGPWGVSIQILIEEWAHSLGTQPLDTLELYRESFLEWLHLNRDRIHSREDRLADTRQLVTNRLVTVREAWAEAVNQLFSDGGLDTAGGTEAFSRWLENRCSEWADGPDIEGLERATARAIFDDPTALVDGWSLADARDEIFADYLRNSQIDEAILFLVEGLVRKVFCRDRSFMLAFAGFGRDDFHASVASVEVQGFVLDDLLVRRFDTMQVPKNSRQALIYRQGDTSAVDTFLYGYSIPFLEQVGESLDSRQVHTANDTGELPSAAEFLAQQLGDISIRERWDKYWDIIAMLPMSRLAEIARQLVNLQSLDLQLRGELQTVSSDCVVAAITPSRAFSYLSADRDAA